MSGYIKYIRTSDGDKQIDYTALANLPPKPQSYTVTLYSSKWDSSELTQTVTVQGVSENETTQLIQPMPSISSMTDYRAFGVKCISQKKDKLIFSADNIPDVDLTIYVVIQDVESVINE